MADSLNVNINLIGKPKVSFSQDFLKWTFNIGRIVIVMTEIVALGALAYRFYIDRKIIDLHDQIKRQEIFVETQAEKEIRYRNIQTRLASIKNTEENTNIKIDIMNQIFGMVDLGNFSSTSLTIDLNSIRFDGVAFSIFPINTFIDELKKNPNVSSISLDDVSSTSTGVQFKINIEIKEKKEINENT